MATYWLPSSSTNYSTSKSGVNYRIRIVENSFNSTNRTLNITVQAYFFRVGTAGYTTDYTHTLKYTVNGTSKSYSNAYGTYTIDDDGVYMNAYTVNVPVNADGSVSVSVYCQYTSTNSSNLTTSNNGGTISLTKQAAKTYTVSYNANGGSGAPSSQTKYHGTTLKLSSVTPTRDGYNFLGWSTSSTATTATYSVGGNYTSNASATLYAVWTQSSMIQTIMARYQNTDGTWGAYDTVYSAALSSGDTCSWSQAETDEFEEASISYTVSDVATKYVSVYRKQYTVSFNANGGVWNPPTITYYYGSNLYLTKRPTRSGYRFLGWALTPDTDEVAYTTTVLYDTTDTSSPTYYAIWSKRSQEIYLYDNGESNVCEYIEGEITGFGEHGIIYASSIIEETLDNNDFAIDTDFIATTLREGSFVKYYLVDNDGNQLVDNNGNYLFDEEEML